MRAAGIPALTLTTDPRPPTPTFMLPVSDRDRQSVVDYAVRQGLRRFAILPDEDTFGRAMSTEYERAIAGAGGF